eukprot:TRINITY_DN1157_c0_g1_i1.p1 TRINITY_DN1157_c0_g1~~TRINITY_DN1157_c0_g1_i1.p1  ORF type:complete len:1045 (+),score=178.43 TRINITY_DN1157_c0_g1_i1:72-3137(+)
MTASTDDSASHLKKPDRAALVGDIDDLLASMKATKVEMSELDASTKFVKTQKESLSTRVGEQAKQLQALKEDEDRQRRRLDVIETTLRAKNEATHKMVAGAKTALRRAGLSTKDSVDDFDEMIRDIQKRIETELLSLAEERQELAKVSKLRTDKREQEARHATMLEQVEKSRAVRDALQVLREKRIQKRSEIAELMELRKQESAQLGDLLEKRSLLKQRMQEVYQQLKKRREMWKQENLQYKVDVKRTSLDKLVGLQEVWKASAPGQHLIAPIDIPVVALLGEALRGASFVKRAMRDVSAEAEAEAVRAMKSKPSDEASNWFDSFDLNVYTMFIYSTYLQWPDFSVKFAETRIEGADKAAQEGTAAKDSLPTSRDSGHEFAASLQLPTGETVLGEGASSRSALLSACTNGCIMLQLKNILRIPKRIKVDVAPFQQKFLLARDFEWFRSLIGKHKVLSFTSAQAAAAGLLRVSKGLVLFGSPDAVDAVACAVRDRCSTVRTEELPTQLRDLGALFGKKGERIAQLQESTGTIVKVPRRDADVKTVSVTGPSAAIDKARAFLSASSMDISEIPAAIYYYLRDMEQIDLAKLACPLYTSIAFHSRSNLRGVLTVTGPEAHVQEVRGRLLAATKGVTVKEMEIPRERHGKIIGPEGRNLLSIQEKTKCFIHFPGKSAKTSLVALAGRPEGIALAEELLAPDVSVITAPFPPLLENYLSRFEPNWLEDLQRSFHERLGCKFIRRGDKFHVQLKGAAQLIEQAKSLVDKKIATLDILTLHVPVARHGFLIGPKGEAVASLQMKHKCLIKFPGREHKDSDSVLVAGPSKALLEVEVEIDRKLKQEPRPARRHDDDTSVTEAVTKPKHLPRQTKQHDSQEALPQIKSTQQHAPSAADFEHGLVPVAHDNTEIQESRTKWSSFASSFVASLPPPKPKRRLVTVQKSEAAEQRRLVIKEDVTSAVSATTDEQKAATEFTPRRMIREAIADLSVAPPTPPINLTEIESIAVREQRLQEQFEKVCGWPISMCS